MRVSLWRIQRAVERDPEVTAVAAIATLILVAGVVVLFAFGPDGGSDEGALGSTVSASSASPPAPTPADTSGGAAVPEVRVVPAPKPPPGPSFDIASVWPGRHVVIRDAPRGRAITRVGARTEFGLPRTFSIAGRSGDWLGVHSPELANGQVGWIRDDREDVQLYSTAYWLQVDLSSRRIGLRYGRRLLERIPVTIGAAGTETPTGDYAVTDVLAGSEIPSYYGCCILALTGHQTNLPAGWIGGDRIAIHGSVGPVGGAASHGCLRASNSDLVQLVARIPLGTPVFIRA